MLSFCLSFLFWKASARTHSYTHSPQTTLDLPDGPNHSQPTENCRRDWLVLASSSARTDHIERTGWLSDQDSGWSAAWESEHADLWKVRRDEDVTLRYSRETPYRLAIAQSGTFQLIFPFLTNPCHGIFANKSLILIYYTDIHNEIFSIFYFIIIILFDVFSNQNYWGAMFLPVHHKRISYIRSVPAYPIWKT